MPSVNIRVIRVQGQPSESGSPTASRPMAVSHRRCQAQILAADCANYVERSGTVAGRATVVQVRVIREIRGKKRSLTTRDAVGEPDSDGWSCTRITRKHLEWLRAIREHPCTGPACSGAPDNVRSGSPTGSRPMAVSHRRCQAISGQPALYTDPTDRHGWRGAIW